MSPQSTHTQNQISRYNHLRSRILENAPVLHGASPRILHHGYTVVISREPTSSFQTNDPLFRASLAGYVGPHETIKTILLRTSDAKAHTIDALEDLLEGMEFELGVRLQHCAVGCALGGTHFASNFSEFGGTLTSEDVEAVHGNDDYGQDVAQPRAYKPYKKRDDPVRVGHEAYKPPSGTC